MKKNNKINDKKLEDYRIFYSQDITFCIAEQCPIREYCFRAIGMLPGIHSISDLSKVCDASNVFSYFKQADMQTINKHRTRKN